MTHPNRVEVFTGTLLATSLATSLCLADTPFPSTYQPPSHTPTLITNATILTGTGQKLEAANLYFVDGPMGQFPFTNLSGQVSMRASMVMVSAESA